MTELLLELFSEEIPARMQDRAASDLARLVGDGLKAVGLAPEKVTHHSTPRRLCVVVEGLADATEDIREERKGPRADAPDKAIEGFLRSTGLTRDDLEERETKKGNVLFAVIEKPGQKTSEVLPPIIEDAIAHLPWPKSMRWGAHQVRWVRPLHSILCLFGGAVLPVSFGPVSAGDSTCGHRFHAPDRFSVTDFADYQAKLLDAKVVLDRKNRMRMINDRAVDITPREFQYQSDPGLLAEVAGLVEWPVPLIGSFDKEFLHVPEEVLITSMKNHQKYFYVRHEKATLTLEGEGKSVRLESLDISLAPYFITVANLEAEDGGAAITAGNEKVLRARLSDARFFWDQDRKQRLDSRLDDLDPIVFHAAMGSMRRKAERISALTVSLAAATGADPGTAARAGLLAKADLTTEMVGEFPELQGLMGMYYARHDGEDEAVAFAVRDHYSPAGPSDPCPEEPVSVAVALADKMDALAGFFSIGEKPTGSKDPYALRRAALGIIRLILENDLRLNLMDAFGSARSALEGDFASAPAVSPSEMAEELYDFITDRLKVALRDGGVRHDLVSAVLALGRDGDLARLTRRINALKALTDSDDGKNLLIAYRRAANILRIEEKKDSATFVGPADRTLFAESAEQSLGAALTGAVQAADNALAAEQFETAMSAMASLRGPVDAFFDAVTVNDRDPARRENRLKLLAEIRDTLHRVADFSVIEG